MRTTGTGDRKKNTIKIISTVLIGIILLVGGVFVFNLRNSGRNADISPGAGTAEVHFIDVGQGDCALIRTDTENILIDSGEYEQYGTVSRYLNSLGVRYLDHIVVSHPHTDHMGCMYRIAEKYGAGDIIMPDMKEHTDDTPQYRRLTGTAEDLGIPIMYAEAGIVIEAGTDCRLEILSPVGEYEDVNDWSVTVRFVCADVKFLFTGDIGREAEQDILASGQDISADVLKVPHHGSGTSSGRTFVQAVSPHYVVFSVGTANDYGHPHSNIVELYRRLGAQILRTDMNGNIVFNTDGNSVTLITDR